MTTIFDAAGGEAGILRLAAAWHERVLSDAVPGGLAVPRWSWDGPVPGGPL